jgi:hypothetical protein
MGKDDLPPFRDTIKGVDSDGHEVDLVIGADVTTRTIYLEFAGERVAIFRNGRWVPAPGSKVTNLQNIYGPALDDDRRH